MATTLGPCGCPGPKHECAQSLFASYTDDKAASDFVQAVLVEVDKARAKFGGQPSLTTGLALAEEMAEVSLAVALNATQPIKKLLHIAEGKSGDDDLYVECVQTAAMALRLATEKADRAAWKGNQPPKQSLAMAAASIPGISPSGYVVPKPAAPVYDDAYWPEGLPPGYTHLIEQEVCRAVGDDAPPCPICGNKAQPLPCPKCNPRAQARHTDK